MLLTKVGSRYRRARDGRTCFQECFDCEFRCAASRDCSEDLAYASGSSCGSGSTNVKRARRELRFTCDTVIAQNRSVRFATIVEYPDHFSDRALFRLWTVAAIAPKPAVVLTTKQTPQARLSATEFTNRKGDSSGQDAGLAGSATVTARSSVTGRQPTGTTGVEFKSEEQTVPATVSSQPSTERTDQALNGPSEYVSSHKPTAVVEQARPSTPGELTPRFVLSGNQTQPLRTRVPSGRARPRNPRSIRKCKSTNRQSAR